VVGVIDLTRPLTQAQFGELVGVSQQAVSEFVKVAALGPGVAGAEMLLAYCERMREMAAGRGSDGELDLVQERAWLAREQRIAQALKNAVTRREFAPVGVLSEVLAAASASVAAKLDALPGLLKKIAPEISDSVRDSIAGEIATARNEWVAETSKLEVKVDPSFEPDAADAEEILLDEGDD
jgi:phage terminase Nu1 subunit (DNA packaging protein)